MNQDQLAKVTLSNSVEFRCEEAVSILDAAKSAGLILEHSCRTGRCGICKAKIVSGKTVQLQSESSLTEDEVAQNFILTCCRGASTDLELDIEDLGDLSKFKSKTVPARIDSLDSVSDDVVQVVLRTPPTNILNYRAGQYVDVIGPAGVRRSYSLANAPREDGKIKLEIRKIENGVMSHYWFNQAKVNDLLRLEGPLGTFCLRPEPSKKLVLLATGTGIAPVKAILEEISSSVSGREQVYQEIYLYWGGRVQSDLYWQPEFPNLPLNFIPVLSREIDWAGRAGYVQQAVLDDQIELNDASVYACGSEAMIRSAREMLVCAGLNPRQFYSDAFVSSS